MTDSDLAHFMVIGAYRDNEVDATHPLMMALSKLEKEAIKPQLITLQNLSEADVNALSADTLHCGADESKPLAQLIHTKTGGNAFFVHQMLNAMDKERLLCTNT
jgi:predicted ATPase